MDGPKYDAGIQRQVEELLLNMREEPSRIGECLDAILDIVQRQVEAALKASKQS